MKIAVNLFNMFYCHAPPLHSHNYRIYYMFFICALCHHHIRGKYAGSAHIHILYSSETFTIRADPFLVVFCFVLLCSLILELETTCALFRIVCAQAAKVLDFFVVAQFLAIAVRLISFPLARSSCTFSCLH